ncbi:MAG: hypothetical protein HDQ97_16390 [Lachnospiraceae bacterium]|nr:hypothetical protein [Lachnospiraceae bacterium]
MKRKEWKKQLLAGMTAISMIWGMMLGTGASSEVQAAEAPVIVNLQVAASEDGTQIMAQCDYQSYDAQSGCVMTLYLYRMETDGETSIAAHRKLPYAGEGKETAVSASATDGIYLASVGMDYNGRITQINSKYYYQVTQSGDKMEVAEVTDAEQNEVSGKELQRENGTCTHNLDYELIRTATAERDALMAQQCTLCGEVFHYVEVPNSAYAAFQQEAIKAIENTQTNEVLISTRQWISFHQSVIDAISQRPDVTVIIHYQYQGEMHEVIIPAGADVSSLTDEGGFFGFLYLNQIFDETSL